LKYGTIPLARASGGLYQIVQDYDPTTDSGNGFLFFDYSSEALWDTIGRAKKFFSNKDNWQSLMVRAMQSDFSWPNAAAEYEKIYQRLVELQQPYTGRSV
jgi:starch synthase